MATWQAMTVLGLAMLLSMGLSGPTGAAEPQTFTEQARRVDGSNYLVGRVTPDASERLVRYQRRLCATCAWKPYETVRTDADGRFRIRIAFPRTVKPTWRYRGYVAGTATHDRTEGRVWLACARETCRP
ncbi:hypothetical protein NPS01_23020 [Nocardioides psychrotolerans]|uniref:Uncharacterized protein n=1 Tax=Nocardioides psychrotolerans TaxID=1005945 RepID=A0A1I3I1Y8_9ACTN|nr:hypothetical protein [Nocardioides psychrotolerans]GEP38639.1 hypothetical protein NPS01_23020 [Nocardioides psychrotolerans]SFI41859.1 hypothetical protein SAMN05216561_10882 [Nocardioides psychrotolerans]